MTRFYTRTLLFLLMSGLFVSGLLVSCAPAVRDVRTDVRTYSAPYNEVFTAVLQTLAADPGIGPYNPGGVNGYRRGASTPWLVTVSDREAGLIVAEARSRAAGFVGSNAPPDVHRVNMQLHTTGNADSAPRTEVTARGTPFTRAFLERLEQTLEDRFEP